MPAFWLISVCFLRKAHIAPESIKICLGVWFPRLIPEGYKFILPFPHFYRVNVTHFQPGEVWEQLPFYDGPFIFYGRRLQTVPHIFHVIFNQARKKDITGSGLLV